jgi:hypothetical protein
MTPSDILTNGLKQAVEANAPQDMIYRLQIAVLSDALARIASLGGGQAIIATAALKSISETN